MERRCWPEVDSRLTFSNARSPVRTNTTCLCEPDCSATRRYPTSWWTSCKSEQQFKRGFVVHAQFNLIGLSSSIYKVQMAERDIFLRTKWSQQCCRSAHMSPDDAITGEFVSHAQHHILIVCDGLRSCEQYDGEPETRGRSGPFE